MVDRKDAERRVGLARMWARAKQILTTDPQASMEDDRLVVDEEAARSLAAHAGRLKGGLAKVAQLAAYHDIRAGRGVRAALGELWDRAPAASAADIARVVEAELGRPPERVFARWDATPLAAASLGQVHAATTHDGEEVVVKVQYPGVADALRGDLDDDGFVRRLAGGEIGAWLDAEAIAAVAEAVRRELDYRAEAAAMSRFAEAWHGDPRIRIPRPFPALSSARVLTMTRARGRTILDLAGTDDAELHRQVAVGVFRFAWGSPLVHGLLDADPNPGNFLVDVGSDGHALVWCLDFGCTLALPDAVRDADRELVFGLLDDDPIAGAERFRLGLARGGLLARADSLASVAHRDWERALALPLQTRGEFAWTAAYASELADATRRVIANGGMKLSAELVMLWRQRLGVSAVMAMLGAQARFRAEMLDLVGTGKRALR